MNCVTVYKDGIPVKAMVCSTGNATPLGTYHIIERYRWKLMIHGVYTQYATRIVGSILFHSVPYNAQNNRTLSTSSYNKLGSTASAGCVRLTCEDAKWIYDNVVDGATVIIYNSSDPGPLGKPSIEKIPAGQTWDPTDTEVK
jgi:lipoprotein-anchoring transpeptidase ErfK/SrfK